MAKLLAADASWAAADMCVQTHGGFGFAEEYDVERKFRETRLYQVAPISTNMILSYLAEHVLGLPRSYLMAEQLGAYIRAMPCRLVRGHATGLGRLASNKPWRRRIAPAGWPTPARA